MGSLGGLDGINEESRPTELTIYILDCDMEMVQ